VDDSYNRLNTPEPVTLRVEITIDVAALGYKGVVQLLIDKGADVSMQDSLGLFPYQKAAANGHKVVAKLLQRQ